MAYPEGSRGLVAYRKVVRTAGNGSPNRGEMVSFVGVLAGNQG